MQSTLLAVALAISAPALKDPPKQEVKLAGEWIVESQVTGGRPLNSKLVRRYIFSAEGKWTMTSAKGKATPTLTRTFTIDATKKPPMIDMKLSAAATANAYTGILKIEGDTMTLCYSRNADERPTQFESPQDSTVVLIVLKRVKKE
mgnify:CR=1 FL=1